MSLRRSSRIKEKTNNELLQKNEGVEDNNILQETTTTTTKKSRKRKAMVDNPTTTTTTKKSRKRKVMVDNLTTTTTTKKSRKKNAMVDNPTTTTATTKTITKTKTKAKATIKNNESVKKLVSEDVDETKKKKIRPYIKKKKTLDPDKDINTKEQDNIETDLNTNNNDDNNDNDNTNKESKIETIDSNNELYSDDDLNIENESQRFIRLLSAAVDLQAINVFPVGSFSRDKKVIEEALNINEKLQHLIEDQIEKIDNRIKENDTSSKTARLLSIREARTKRHRIDIHRPYTTTKNQFDYFKEFYGVDLPEDEDNHDNQDVERPRAWQMKERETLSTAIQTEVQRITAYGHISRNEAWRVWEVDNIPKKEWENYPVNKLDWNRISNLYVKTRTPMECMIQWTTQDHPSINKKPWSKKESETLRQLVNEHGYEGQWEKIASQLNTNRTASQCFSHYQAEFNALNAKRPWSKEDDEALKDAVTLVGDKNWQQVASIIGGRSGQQCLHRWVKSINPAIRRSRWTEEEDNALRGAVDVYGIGNWTSIQRHLPGRTDMQCRERWMNCLDPAISHSSFNEEENQKLKDLVEKYGKRWSFITQFMPGRTDNQLLRQWRSFQRPPGKKGRKKKL